MPYFTSLIPDQSETFQPVFSMPEYDPDYLLKFPHCNVFSWTTRFWFVFGEFPGITKSGFEQPGRHIHVLLRLRLKRPRESWRRSACISASRGTWSTWCLWRLSSSRRCSGFSSRPSRWRARSWRWMWSSSSCARCRFSPSVHSLAPSSSWLGTWYGCCVTAYGRCMTAYGRCVTTCGDCVTPYVCCVTACGCCVWFRCSTKTRSGETGARLSGDALMMLSFCSVLFCFLFCVVCWQLEDLKQFVIILLVFILAYGIASQAVLFPGPGAYEKSGWEILRGIVDWPYWQMYGELFLDEMQG